jgi:hypothetical protein
VTRHFLLILVALTSLGVCWSGMKLFGFSAQALPPAFGKVMESVGYTLLFLALNLVVAVMVILAARVLMGGFVSLYHAADVTLLVVAFLQGLTFQWWREISHRRT